MLELTLSMGIYCCEVPKRIYLMILRIDELNELSHAFDTYSLVKAMNEGESWADSERVAETTIQEEISKIKYSLLDYLGEFCLTSPRQTRRDRG